jgi:hypothetical protein
MHVYDMIDVGTIRWMTASSQNTYIIHRWQQLTTGGIH